jgi:chromosomal replication initiation ATPase DnaA
MKYFNSDAILGRDDVLQQINDTIKQRAQDKYQPIIISTSRGMGKTFLMKCVGTQNVKKRLNVD